MPIAPAHLPSDVATLRAMLAKQAAEITLKKTELTAVRAGLVEQRCEIEALRVRLARALRVAFGRSSDKLRDKLEQLELTLADIDEILAETSHRSRNRQQRRRTRPSRASPRGAVA